MAHGRIVNVVDREVGSRLAGDLASGATVLIVDDVFLFNEAEDDSGDPIGTLQIGDEIYEYVSTDDDENTITLVSATTEDYTDLDWVLVAPATTEKYATVELDGGGSTEFKIPFLLWAWLSEATRENLVGEWVRLSFDGQQYVFEDFWSVPKKLNGGVIDPDSTIPLPALSDGEAPSGSPTPTLEQFSVGGLKWSVTPVANVDPVRFKVYADTVDPPTEDAAHLVADSASHSGMFSTINGIRILPDDPTVAPDPIFVAVVEYDADGEAAMGASSAPVVPRRADERDISALFAYLGFIEANQIAAGSILTQLLGVGSFIEIDGANSYITIYGDVEHTQPLVQLRPDGSVFRGRVIADDVSVLNGLVLQGLLSHIAQNAGVTLDTGVSDPAAAPTLTVKPSQSIWPDVPSGYSARGITWDGTNWLRLIRSETGTTTKVETINTSGVRTSTVTLNNMTTSLNASGIVKLGSNWYVMARLNSDDEAAVWRIYKYDTSGNRSAVSSASYVTNSGRRPAIGTDGTNLLVLNGYDEVFVDVVNTSLVNGANYIVDEDLVDFDSTNFMYVGRGNFDFGADRFAIASGTDAYVFTLSGTDLNHDATKSFQLADNVFYGGFGWNGSNFFSSRTFLNKYNSYYPAASEKAYVAYRDNNGSDHTKVSPMANVALKKRQYVQASLSPAPSGAATPSVWMKLATSAPAATALLARSETITTRNVLLDPSVAGGSALTTDTNSFGTGTPGWIKSQLGGYQLNGDGTESSPLLGHSDQKTLSADANPTSTTNVNLTSLNMSVDVKSTSDVVWVEIDAEIATAIANSLNTIELLIDGSAQSVQLRTRLQSINDRYSGHKKWRITGLAAGSHTIAFRTRNSAASTDVTIVSAHTVASYWTST